MSNAAPTITVNLGDSFLVLSDRREFDASANLYEVVSYYDQTTMRQETAPAFRGCVDTADYASLPTVRLEENMAFGDRLVAVSWGEDDDSVYDTFFPIGMVG